MVQARWPLWAPWSFTVHGVPLAHPPGVIFLYPLPSPTPYNWPTSICMETHTHTHSFGSNISSSEKYSLCFWVRFCHLDSSSQSILHFSFLLNITIAIFAHYKMCLFHWDINPVRAAHFCFVLLFPNKGKILNTVNIYWMKVQFFTSWLYIILLQRCIQMASHVLCFLLTIASIFTNITKSMWIKPNLLPSLLFSLSGYRTSSLFVMFHF